MLAAILYGREDLRVEESPEKPLVTGEVRVQIESALTCGTDLKVYRRGEHPRMLRTPSPFGHEWAGKISEVGPGVQGWKKGDRVVGANSAPCGQCYFCTHRLENLCDELLFLNGAYAQTIQVPRRIVEKNLLPIPESVGFRDAALTEPLACVIQGWNDLQLQAGERVLVMGSGPIGLMFVALCARRGCPVILAGRGRERLAKARQLGAESVIDITGASSLVDLIRQKAPHPFEVVIEAVGKPETWEAAVELVRKGGRINFFGGCPKGSRVPLNADRIHYSSLSFRGSFHHTPATIRQALAAIESGEVKGSDFIDGEAELKSLPELFRSMAAGNRAVKIAVSVR